jgi:hypothetical protein
VREKRKRKEAQRYPESRACITVESFMDLEELSRRLSAEIDNYVYDYTDELVGAPWGTDRIKTGIRELQSALIEPYWARVIRRDTIEQIASADPPVCRCAVVADDGKGTLLVFDPAAAEFLLARRITDTLESYGVSGDVVGCFMAR